MEELLTWLFSFFFLILLLLIIGYQLMCLTDLEFDYVSPYNLASKVNRVVLLEFAIQGILCLIHLIVGHWVFCLLALPYLYYNINSYLWKKHLVDITEIYNQLSSQKNARFYKFSHTIVMLTASMFWMIWSVDDNYED